MLQDFFVKHDLQAGDRHGRRRTTTTCAPRCRHPAGRAGHGPLRRPLRAARVRRHRLTRRRGDRRRPSSATSPGDRSTGRRVSRAARPRRSTCGARVAGGALLVDHQQHRVAVAVQPDLVHLLGVPGGLALHPQLSRLREKYVARPGRPACGAAPRRPSTPPSAPRRCPGAGRPRRPGRRRCASAGRRSPGPDRGHRTVTDLRLPQRVLDLADAQLSEVEHAGGEHRVRAGGAPRAAKCATSPAPPLTRSAARPPRRAPAGSARGRSRPWCRRRPSSSAGSPPRPAPGPGRPTRPRRCRCPCGRRAWSPRTRTACRGARRASTDSTTHCAPNRCDASASSSGRRIAAVLMRHLVRTRPQQSVHIGRRTHAAADGQRDEHLLGRAPHDVEGRLAVRRGRRDVQEGQLVGALRVVGARQLDRVARVDAGW